MGSVIFKPRRAKCHECGNGMIKKHNSQKYHPSCQKVVKRRQIYASNVRNGYIKSPGIGTAHGSIMWGDKHPNFTGSLRWQRKYFRGTECERCGSGGDMHLHHRDRDRSNWEKGNLETLCIPCHNAEHKGEEDVAA